MARLVRSSLPVAAALLALAGCAPRVAQGPVQVAEAPPPPAPPAMPEPPAGLPVNLAVPPVDANGDYQTINRGLDSAETAWHMRSALNVAALGCRGAQEMEIIAAYNAMLKNQKATLAAALTMTTAHFKAEQGRDWQAEHDRHMTRVYNFFAQPIAQQRFCATAAAVLAEVATVSTKDFPAFAAAALPRLEAPFTDAYRAYDGYRRDLAMWQARYGTALATGATATPASASRAPASAAGATAAPQLAYEDLGELIRWDGRNLPMRTALR